MVPNRDNGKDNGNSRDYRLYIGDYRGYIGIVEKKMETAICIYSSFRFPLSLYSPNIFRMN